MNRKTIVLLAAGALSLAACSSAKEQLGMTKHSPDEFAVVKRAPLSMPPDYGLAPPSPGAPRPQEQTTAQEAKESVFGAAKAPVKSGGGEDVLLGKAGAENIDPNIRTEVDAETAKEAKENVPVAKKIFGLGGTPETAPASVVNATKETERLKKNQAQGKPATAGNTPAIEE